LNVIRKEDLGLISENQNVDQTEINKFENIASEWWDTTGKFKPLHEINPLRLQFIQQTTSLNAKSIIDIGCGGGILSESMAKAGANVTAIDMSELAIKIAKQHAKDNKLHIDYQVISAESQAEQNKTYDVVTCMELLEHVPDPESIISACAKLVNKGGYVFISTINRNLKAYLFAIMGAEYLLNLLPKNTHQYDKFIRPSEIDLWARNAGLTLQQIKGITYNPIQRQYHLVDNIDVNYLISAKKA